MDLERIMDGQDLLSSTSTAMRVVDSVRNKVGLILLYGVVMLWSYIVNTVFYCECRKRHVNRVEDESVARKEESFVNVLRIEDSLGAV
ncbi:hypothetical protein CFP56_031467 [Quercus suber]|uniref:Uncharacterized protein n=1 Tax=Quercus suber TaxID=58331 RepID=A0AAW0LVS6_QUESU